MQIQDLATRPDLIPTLAAWHQAQWQALNPNRTLEQRIAVMQDYLSAQLIPSTFIALDRQLLGSAALVASDMDSHPEWTPWLASVYVAEPFRRQGVGSCLVRHAVRKASMAGIAKVYLFTPDRQDFYLQLGWQTISEEEYRQHAVTVMCIET